MNGGISVKIYISTFGEFDIKSDGNSLLKDLGRTYRLYKLFQYFLTFRQKKLLPETIIDNLWSDSESSDPKNMLRTQIFRLRGFIKSLFPEGEDDNKYITVDFINGYYCLNMGENVKLDVDEFEQLINQGDLLKKENEDSAIQKYYEAINIYKGLYLSENTYEIWIVPTRNYYNRLYLKTLHKLINLLKSKKEFEKIISLCENALLIDSYDEDIHIQMMDALLFMGLHKEALNHYENTVLLLEKEVDAKPSGEFTSFLKKIQSYSSSYSKIIDIDSISNDLNNINVEGALCCSKEDFNFLINVQKRRSLRQNEFDYIGLFTINESIYLNNSKLMEEYSIAINEVLEKSLRKGDVFSFLNDNQIIMLLHDVHNDGIIRIKNRIKKNMKMYDFINLDSLTLTFQPLDYENIVI